jgi:CRISPR type I-F-associated protein Csy2
VNGHIAQYVVIPFLRVEHANALQTWWIVAPPSPMTVCGFVRNAGMKLQSPVQTFAIVHHDVQFLVGADRWNGTKKPFRCRESGAHQQRGASYIDKNDYLSGGFALALQPTVRCHVTVSLVLGMPPGGCVSSEVCDFLADARFAGGSIVDHGDVVIEDSLDGVRKALRGGFFVADRSDLVLQRMHSAEKGGNPMDGLEAILDELIAPPKASKQTWLSANVVGYAALEAPQPRGGVRTDAPHAYAEAIVGLIQYQSVHDTPDIPFWRYQADPARGTYLVRSTKEYKGIEDE